MSAIVPVRLDKIAGDLPQDKVVGLVDDLADCVKTNASYADPAWLTSVAGSKITGNISGNAASITGSITQSQVTNLVANLASKAALASPSFTGVVTVTAAASTEYGLIIKSANTGVAYGWYIGQGYPGSYDGDLLIGKAGVGRVLKIDSFGLEIMASGGCVTFRQSNTGIQANHGNTRLITPDGSLNWIFGAQGQIQIQIAGDAFATLTSSGWQFSVAPKLPTLADASIPNSGLAWSSDDANVLKCRTPAGTLKVVNLT